MRIMLFFQSMYCVHVCVCTGVSQYVCVCVGWRSEANLWGSSEAIHLIFRDRVSHCDMELTNELDWPDPVLSFSPITRVVSMCYWVPIFDVGSGD